MVTLTKLPEAQGPTALTVFSDEHGAFAFPPTAPAGTLSVRLLGYRQVESPLPGVPPDPATLLMRPEANQAGTAPASAYLRGITRDADREALIDTCVGCHQLPAPEVRAYAKLLDDTPQTQTPAAHEKSWEAVVQQMNYISAKEFSRAGGPASAGESVYSGGEPGPTAKLLAGALHGPLQEVRGYTYGAPLLVNMRTVIREYQVPEPNAIREAVTLDDANTLFAADVSSNRVFRIDTASGAIRALTIPGPDLLGPHTLVRGSDGLWVGPFFPGHVARLDPKTESWKLWPLAPMDGHPVGLHDLSFDTNHDLTTDRRGRVWFSDIANNAIGWLDPRTGASGTYPIPTVPGRKGGEQVYGLAMSPDRTHVWYCQVGIGSFGSFNTETLKFEIQVSLPSPTSGPRRISMSDDGVLYLALYGAGQLAAYDTRARKMIGIYDLPDRASAPYSTTWDPKRKVVWITTSNADAIYRFDPTAKSFSVLPLPRERAFLRSVNVDRQTGALVTSYANIVEHVRGPRMAVIIDLGDMVTPTRAATPVVPSFADSSTHAADSKPKPSELALQKHCDECHAVDAARIGPPFVAVAARHRAEGTAAVEPLAQKIIHGGGGNWGNIPMIPNERVTLEEARGLVRWILSLNPS
jgi:cytochrome c